MVISLKKLVRPIVVILIAIIVLGTLWVAFGGKTIKFIMGGFVHTNNNFVQEYSQSAFNSYETGNYSERFQRPSKQPALELKYSFEDFVSTDYQHPYIHKKFKISIDVIHAYYAILKEASNMIGYHGGCGTIGQARIPYPYAYDLLTTEAKQQMSLKEFEKSFSGIGHTTLLKLYTAYKPPNTADSIEYYMVEIEVITGPPYKEENKNKPQPSYFAYYYGLVTVENVPSEGWKIKTVDYIPEDFLCAPYHHWYWDAKGVVEIIYKNWYGLIEEIEKVEKENSLIYIYASGNHNKYRFDFVRLTNGQDILLHEYILQDGQWKEVNLLKEEDQIFKFSILNPNLKLE